MIIEAFFKGNAAFINGHVVSHTFKIDETVEFLIDTGASRTTLLDRDAIFMGINYDRIPKHKQQVSGIGGTVETHIITDAFLTLKSGNYRKDFSMPILVLKHPLERMSERERIRIWRLPSILGRDIINQFRLIFDHPKKLSYLEA